MKESKSPREFRDCPCPQPFKDAAYCDDCPYREEDGEAESREGYYTAMEILDA